MTKSREPKRHPGVGKCKSKMVDWRVLDRHSRYVGGAHQRAESSRCKCMKCGHTWRTKADYIALMGDASPKERFK